MQCTKPIRIFGKKGTCKGENFYLRYPEGLLVPCGKCMSCKKKKSYEWSMRCLHELVSHEFNVFVTLTYDDDHVPDNHSLVKRDLQLFFKRLRKRLGEKRIRYFACGEYGDKYYRPHYHAIIFGLGLCDDDKQLIIDSWDKGFCHFGLAEPASIRYVSQYIAKKFDGDLAEEVYEQTGRECVFKLSSLGIGRDFADNNRDQILQQLMVTVNGCKMSLPRYYVNRLRVPLDEAMSKALEVDMDLVESITGIADLSRDDAYKCLTVLDIVELEDKLNDIADNRARHVEAKVKLQIQKSHKM
nr:MAG: replication initiator protein [Microviridae sp.]